MRKQEKNTLIKKGAVPDKKRTVNVEFSEDQKNKYDELVKFSGDIGLSLAQTMRQAWAFYKKAYDNGELKF